MGCLPSSIPELFLESRPLGPYRAGNLRKLSTSFPREQKRELSSCDVPPSSLRKQLKYHLRKSHRGVCVKTLVVKLNKLGRGQATKRGIQPNRGRARPRHGPL